MPTNITLTEEERLMLEFLVRNFRVTLQSPKRFTDSGSSDSVRTCDSLLEKLR